MSLRKGIGFCQQSESNLNDLAFFLIDYKKIKRYNYIKHKTSYVKWKVSYTLNLQLIRRMKYK